MLSKVNDNLYILVRLRNGQTQFTFYYSIHIPFNTLRNHTRINSFLNNNPTPGNLTHTADKLKWYRYSNCVHQEDIAKVAGIDRTTYIRYESSDLDFYPIEKLKLIAEFYGIDVTQLLDDYNLYMYKGQGQQVKALRKKYGDDTESVRFTFQSEIFKHQKLGNRQMQDVQVNMGTTAKINPTVKTMGLIQYY